MRLLVEILVITVLVASAWEKPFRERIGEAVPFLAKQEHATKTPRAGRAAPAPTPATASSGAWMWERKGALDRPSYKDSQVPTGHVFYKDDTGKSYWIDALGQRHYGSQ